MNTDTKAQNLPNLIADVNRHPTVTSKQRTNFQ